MNRGCLVLGFFTLYLAVAPGAEPQPRIFYSKSFPGSTPAYVQITVDRTGRVEYREAADDNDPYVSKLSPSEVNEMFALAEKLDWFRKPLESGLKVAKMGEKTFRMENHDPAGEVKFNFTLDENGKLLHDWFERLTESAIIRAALERTVRFDKLGVNKVLLQLESLYDRKRLLGLEQYLPMLDRVAKNESYLHMARERAAGLAEAFRAATAKSE
ncbi:MAG: hypothetical protein NZV14_19640 [Bryobacteraceae bacterium]|nr:hypothetical protein [Bryobacteraceae bacterium]MDW8380378.1 hypothetical protein [Bryobacterales bacterium]